MKTHIILMFSILAFLILFSNVYAYTNIRWQCSLDEIVTPNAIKSSSSIIKNENFYFVRNNSFFHINLHNGDIIYQLGNATSYTLSKYGLVVLSPNRRKLNCLDLTKYQEIWSKTIDDYGFTQPYVFKNKLFYQFNDDGHARLYCVDMSNNYETICDRVTGSDPRSNYSIIDNLLFAESFIVNSEDRAFVTICLNLDICKVIWDKVQSYPVGATNQQVIVRLSGTYVEKDIFAALTPNDGTILWKFESNSYITAQNNSIYLGYNNESSSTYTLYSLKPNNGNIQWQYQTPGFINTKPILHKNNLYMGSNENKIYCFNAKTGEIKWTFNINGFPVAASDDCLFIDDNGKLSCMIINPVTVQHPFDTYAITSDDPSSITVSDSTIASISGNTINALKNGRITVKFQLMNFTHEMPIFCYHKTDTRELETNNTKSAATLLKENTFLKADLFENDVDYFKINLNQSTVLDLAFLPFSNTTLVNIKVFDPFGNQMAWDESSHGKPLIMPLSLSKGTYYIQIQYSDTSYIDHDTTSYILAYQSYQKPYDLRQMEYEPNNAPHVSDFLQNNKYPVISFRVDNSIKFNY